MAIIILASAQYSIVYTVHTVQIYTNTVVKCETQERRPKKKKQKKLLKIVYRILFLLFTRRAMFAQCTQTLDSFRFHLGTCPNALLPILYVLSRKHP